MTQHKQVYAYFVLVEPPTTPPPLRTVINSEPDGCVFFYSIIFLCKAPNDALPLCYVLELRVPSTVVYTRHRAPPLSRRSHAEHGYYTL